MNVETAELWRFLPVGYALSVAIETPILLLALSARHPLGRRVLAGFWLTACTYPIVVLVLPELIWRPLGEAGYWSYVVVAEIFAPAAECGLFWWAFWRHSRGSLRDRQPSNGDSQARNRKGHDVGQDMLAIIAANLCSFVIGGWIVSQLFVG
jgi:hypothetical protein